MRRGPITILYGTETGTACDVALDLAERILSEFPTDGDVFVSSADAALPLDKALGNRNTNEDDDDDNAFPPLVVLVIATSGQGDTPGTMRSFWRSLLRRSLPPGCLSGLHFAIAGLGDSGYALFCAAARRASARLRQLGATEAVESLLGDDRHPRGVHWQVGKWADQLLNTVAIRTGWERALPRVDAVTGEKKGAADDYVVPELGSAAPSRYALVPGWTSDGETATETPYPFGPCPEGCGAVLAKVVLNERLTAADHDQDVRRIVLSVPDTFKYEAGDVAAVMPSALPERVDSFLALFPDVDPDAHVTVVPRGGDGDGGPRRVSAVDSSAPVPPLRTTIRTLLERYVDAGAVPRARFFAKLAPFATDPNERDRLAYFGSPGGCDDLQRYSFAMRRTVTEALVDFPSARPPPEHWLDILPLLRERYFSICSGPAPGKVELCVAVVRYKTRMATERIGVCSTWLSSLPVGGTLPVWLRRSSLRVPPSPSTPAIMIGPGTGVAPFRAFLEYRKSRLDSGTWAANTSTDSGNATTGESPGPWWLFFGSRRRNGDFLFGDEYESLLTIPGDRLVTAFSRDQVSPTGGRLYVTHRMKECGREIWDLLQRGSHVYVAGSSGQMPRDVREALVDISSTHGGITADEAEAFVARMEVTKRYIAETW